MENAQPLVSMSDIEHLVWATRKKVVDDEVCVVTKFTFEAEPTADQLHTIHNLLKNGGPLSITFRSPKLQLKMDLGEIAESKGKLGESSEQP